MHISSYDLSTPFVRMVGKGYEKNFRFYTGCCSFWGVVRSIALGKCHHLFQLIRRSSGLLARHAAIKRGSTSEVTFRLEQQLLEDDLGKSW